MNRPRIVIAVAAIGLLTGCSSDIEQLRRTQPIGGSEFKRALADEYRQTVDFEADEMHDWPDASHFARKGLAAARGDAVPPEDLSDWDIPAGMIEELAAARSRLITLLDNGGRDTNPVLMARAQSRFDCWVENAEENHQPRHVTACREEFYAATEVENDFMGAEPTDKGGLPPVYVVLFDFDDASIRPDGQPVLLQLLADARSLGDADDTTVVDYARLYIVAHADRSGSAGYNRALSLRRARVVRQTLMAGGVSPKQIAVAACGEDSPVIPTDDGAREQANRSVEIVLQCDLELAAGSGTTPDYCPRPISLSGCSGR